MGPVGPIHLLGPVGPIHLLGPVGPIHLGAFKLGNFSKKGIFFSHFHENEILGYFLFRRSFLGHILELCRTRRKRLENQLFRNGSWTT